MLKPNVKASCITVSDGEDQLIASRAFVSQMHKKGFELTLSRQDLFPPLLKYNINLNALHTKNLSLYIPSMEMDLEGTVARTQHMGQGTFKICLEFLKESPKYYNECLFELWPSSSPVF